MSCVRHCHGVFCSWWSLLFPFVPWEFFHRTFEFLYCVGSTSVSFGLQVHKLLFFYVFLMCAVCCDCDACVLHSLANSNWCSVVRKLRYSWRLFAWGILGHDNKRGVGVHASHLHFPKIDRLRLLQCNPYCQECLLEVHALAWENMSDGACGDRIKLITIGNHGIPDTFYLQIPKRAHFL